MLPLQRKQLVYPILYAAAVALDACHDAGYEPYTALRRPYIALAGIAPTPATPLRDLHSSEYTRALLVASLLRYLLAQVFTAFCNWDSLFAASWAPFYRLARGNPPVHQLERELDYDGAYIGSALAMFAVKVVTDLGDEVYESETQGLSLYSLFLCFVVGHYCLVEPVYYLFHRVLHTPYYYSLLHRHHHGSRATQPVSGTSHPPLEMLGYLIVFSLPFLVPALAGAFSKALVAPYFLFFDAMNLVGHSNLESRVEIIPGPLKYLIYSSSYHSLHHTQYRVNLALFCPLWDALGGTVIWPAAVSEKQLRYLRPRPETPVKAVFLGHGLFLHSWFATPWMSPYLASQPRQFEPWMAPFLPCIWLFSYCLKKYNSAIAASKNIQPWAMQRFSFGSVAGDDVLPCALWCTPTSIYDYLGLQKHEKQRDYVDLVVWHSILEADKAGTSHLGLGACNKNESLNRGGLDYLERIEKEELKVKLVTGNSLTCAVVFENVKRMVESRTPTSNLVILTGGTSKIGQALTLLLLDHGLDVLLVTEAEDRFRDLQARAVEEGIVSHEKTVCERLRRAATARDALESADPTAVAAWVCGKILPNAELTLVITQLLLAHKVPLLNFAVPGVDAEHGRRVVKSCGADPRLFLPAAGDVYLCPSAARHCDLTQNVGAESGSLPACLAALLVSASEGSSEHELGPVHWREAQSWWARAHTHGFRLGRDAAEQSGEGMAAAGGALSSEWASRRLGRLLSGRHPRPEPNGEDDPPPPKRRRLSDGEASSSTSVVRMLALPFVQR